eukprot:Opistho-1_new@80988
MLRARLPRHPHRLRGVPLRTACAWRRVAVALRRLPEVLLEVVCDHRDAHEERADQRTLNVKRIDAEHYAKSRHVRVRRGNPSVNGRVRRPPEQDVRREHEQRGKVVAPQQQLERPDDADPPRPHKRENGKQRREERGEVHKVESDGAEGEPREARVEDAHLERRHEETAHGTGERIGNAALVRLSDRKRAKDEVGEVLVREQQVEEGRQEHNAADGVAEDKREQLGEQADDRRDAHRRVPQHRRPKAARNGRRLRHGTCGFVLAAIPEHLPSANEHRRAHLLHDVAHVLQPEFRHAPVRERRHERVCHGKPAHHEVPLWRRRRRVRRLSRAAANRPCERRRRARARHIRRRSAVPRPIRIAVDEGVVAVHSPGSTHARRGCRPLPRGRWLGREGLKRRLDGVEGNGEVAAVHALRPARFEPVAAVGDARVQRGNDAAAVEEKSVHVAPRNLLVEKGDGRVDGAAPLRHALVHEERAEQRPHVLCVDT